MPQIPAHYGVTGDNLPLTGCTGSDLTPPDVAKRSVTHILSVKPLKLKLAVDVRDKYNVIYHRLNSLCSDYCIPHEHNCSRQSSCSDYLVLAVPERHDIPLDV